MQSVLTAEQYTIEKAICDKARAYWKVNATFRRDGSSSLSANLATHPDYAACDNAMRGRVEQYEILRDLPERIGAYIAQSDQSLSVTVWTSLAIGKAVETAKWKTPHSYVSSHMYQYSATIGGREYTGRGGGIGMFVSLRETAASKRNRGV